MSQHVIIDNKGTRGRRCYKLKGTQREKQRVTQMKGQERGTEYQTKKARDERRGCSAPMSRAH